MHLLGDSTAAATFDRTEDAEEAWGILTDAGIPAAVVTDPGMLGRFSVSVMVERDDLDAAQAALAPLIRRLR